MSEWSKLILRLSRTSDLAQRSIDIARLEGAAFVEIDDLARRAAVKGDLVSALSRPIRRGAK